MSAIECGAGAPSVGRARWTLWMIVPVVTIALPVLGFPSSLRAQQTDDFVRIMPLGDSITESSTGYASYRYFLWKELRSLDQSIDFVGTLHGVRSGPPLYEDFDQDHEGHSGFRIDQILTQIRSWADLDRPQIALIHLGTNDLWQGKDVPTAITELGLVIDELRLANPTIKILLAQIIPVAPSKGFDVSAFNAEIPSLAATKGLLESPVVVVDQFTGFDAATDTYDGVHPNNSGEIKMASQWLAPLLDWLQYCEASWNNYGAGHAGTLGVPSLTARANPVVGTKLTIDVQNSLGSPTRGGLLLGSGTDAALTPWDGVRLVRAPIIQGMALVAGINPLVFPIEDDPSLCGIHVYLQVLQLDAGASKGMSFTPGLRLILGE